MSTDVPANTTLTKDEQDDILLKQTQEKRILIVDTIFKEGVPHDVEILNVALKALDSVDKQIHTNRKISNEDKANQTQEQIASIMAVIASNTTTISNPASISQSVPDVPIETLLQRPLVDGETSSGVVEELSYEGFMPKVSD